MRFQTPLGGATFEIPDDWWLFAEMDSFRPGSEFYPPMQAEFEAVPIADVEVPLRDAGVPLFKKYKLVPILFAFRSPECALPPVNVFRFETTSGPSLRVCNGYHRYYASVAVGYAKLPVLIWDPPVEFEVEAMR